MSFLNKNIMSKKNLLCLLILGFFFLIVQDIYAQGKKPSKVDEYFDESGSLSSRLWYGGGFNLGFSGSNGFSAFLLGISPMVGVKVFENNNNFSIGPRISLEYSYFRGLGTDGNSHSVQPISYAVSAFTRYKVLNNFFAHLEVQQENRQLVTTASNGFTNFLVIGIDGKPITERVSRQNAYIGAGYTSGGVIAYEIMVLYNVLEPENSLRLPFDIRFGFTYKF